MQSGLIFIALAIVYTIAKIFLEKRLAPLDADSNDRQLSDLAYSLGCSAYDIFQEAGSKWNFSAAKIEKDFREYLSDSKIHKYVSDFVFHHSTTNDQSYQKLLYPGGRPPFL